MSVIKDTKLCQPFNNDYGPLNVMWNGKKIAGWSNKSKGCNNTSITLTGTYKDKLDYILHGKTKIKGGATTGKWIQLVKNPKPRTDRTEWIEGKEGTVTFTNSGVEMWVGESMCRIGVQLSRFIQNNHIYLIFFTASGAWGDGAYFRAGANSSTKKFRPLEEHFYYFAVVYDAGIYNSRYDYIDLDLICSSPYSDYITVDDLMMVDLTELWGSDKVEDPSYYNNSYDNMKACVERVVSVNPTPDATTESEVPNVEIPYFSTVISPESPTTLTTEEVWIETSDGVSTDRITRDDLHVWDELYSSSKKISSYGAVKTFGEINWSDDTDDTNIFYWNGSSDIYKTENVFMDSYKRVETYDELHGSDYAYWVNDYNKRVYVKDKDISAVVDFKDIRGNCKIFYHKSWSDATETKVELPVTYPYTTLVKTNTDCTVTYKKWDDSETD